ncbi:potassium-transporting ATPase subunit KdpC [Arsenicicoccus dermatophilus]|uniref:potassium-transporting ATPase subunit KdpC n=1 Tax=Arsenicicoccus dermatophilus TaxID=1076331 RepID=UPI001F4CB199|nr:potassium-transporting ATPase subunit KdpC [Arsenicicoccus dermatophilus]MCH8611536.1 potassium-transporting ATPase subunit KdpC [Arsenicicoccus dermatophilus]
MTFLRHTWAALRALIVLTLLLGVVYPLGMTAVAGALPGTGHEVTVAGRVVGDSRIGQPFSEPRWFQGRPSAVEHPGEASGGSNLGPHHPDLARQVAERRAALRQANPQAPEAIPADALTASASGVDPDISPAYARWQVARVAAARHLGVEQIQRLVDAHTTRARWGFVGSDTVNVLELNAALTRLGA